MTDRYAVIGNPIAHSKSPALHAAFARQCGQDIRYEAILGPLDGFRAAVEAFRQAGGRGMNVTVPFKVEALALADTLTERARLAQAVNTLRFDADGIFGDNTDGIGLVNDIQQRLGFAIGGKRVLILGAGGAARGSVLPWPRRARPGSSSSTAPRPGPRRCASSLPAWRRSTSSPATGWPGSASTSSSTPPRRACTARACRCRRASSPRRAGL
jgi:hypothetical protein